jgi:hypothetical protein
VPTLSTLPPGHSLNVSALPPHDTCVKKLATAGVKRKVATIYESDEEDKDEEETLAVTSASAEEGVEWDMGDLLGKALAFVTQVRFIPCLYRVRITLILQMSSRFTFLLRLTPTSLSAASTRA